eukprot:TRINITY_DN22701_c0_g1_i1.p1 TRINITY_DN22701_c0_g1~~TRINITY_DN22701_c0_g1_i1.p1  ORF type:complete len:387 (+),score=46.44 TRINITY_DN22701_c0_g1_i1:41-1201(+)
MSFDIETGLTSLEEMMSRVRMTSKGLTAREQELDLREEELNKRDAELRKRELALERSQQEDKLMAGRVQKLDDVIELNIGGEITTTLRSTLTKYDQTFLSAMFSGKFPLTTDSLGKVFIDRPAKPFLTILNWLRTGKWHSPPTTDTEERLLLSEIEYFGLTKYVLQQSSPAVLPGSVSPQPLGVPPTGIVCTPVLGPSDDFLPCPVIEERISSGIRPKAVQRNVSWSWNTGSSCFLSGSNKKAIPKVGDNLLVPVFTDEVITGGECIEVDVIGIQPGLELECGVINGQPPKSMTNENQQQAIGFKCDTTEGSDVPVPLMGCISFTLLLSASWPTPGSPGELKIYKSSQGSTPWREAPIHVAQIPSGGREGWRFAIYSPAGVELILK